MAIWRQNGWLKKRAKVKDPRSVALLPIDPTFEETHPPVFDEEIRLIDLISSIVHS